MAADGWLIDQEGRNVYEELASYRENDISGGEVMLKRLSRAFYTRVYNDTEATWFRDIFADRPIENSIQNQYEFFIQRLGGPPIYSRRKGHPALRGRHASFPVTAEAAERWMYHMRAALDEVQMPEKQRKAMEEFLEETARFLINR